MINELSIIIPALNEEKYLPALLSSLINQQLPEKLQVIIVDGQSVDKTVREADKFKSSIPDLLILKTKRGIGYQRNRGAEKAKYKYLLFLDADMVLPPNFFKRLLPKINPREKFIDTVIMWASEFDILTNAMIALMYPIALAVTYKEHFVPGGFILTTEENHRQIKGFREDISLGEDLDYGVRSTKNGAKLHVHLFPYALHTARRVYKMGRINFFKHHITAYRYLKKNGTAAMSKKFPYPYSEY